MVKQAVNPARMMTRYDTNTRRISTAVHDALIGTRRGGAAAGSPNKPIALPDREKQGGVVAGHERGPAINLYRHLRRFRGESKAKDSIGAVRSGLLLHGLLGGFGQSCTGGGAVAGRERIEKVVDDRVGASTVRFQGRATPKSTHTGNDAHSGRRAMCPVWSSGLSRGGIVHGVRDNITAITDLTMKESHDRSQRHRCRSRRWSR